MLRSDFDFELPKELIAQRPAPRRSASRLLSLDGPSGACEDLQFTDLPALLHAHDLLVFNDTRVIPARAYGIKDSGGRVELLLERALGANTALVHARASKGLRPGTVVRLAAGTQAKMLERDAELYRLEFSCDVVQFFQEHGQIPLPPYIGREADASDSERYQTVFAQQLGAVAAPTAGLHFDASTFAALEARGVRHAFITLHVGSGTFAPMRTPDLESHRMHAEHVEVSPAACAAIGEARSAGGRIVAVGTTVVRSLETAAAGDGLRPYRGMTDIFIKPGHRFRAVDALVSNFHLPQSTLVMLCAAFAGREALLNAYRHAIAERYRFFSYGDAMFMTPAAGPHP